MATVDVIDVTGKKSGSAELPAAMFDVQTNVPLIHQVVVAQRQRGQHLLRGGGDDQNLCCAWKEGAHRRAAGAVAVRAEHRERVAMGPLADQRDIGGVEHGDGADVGAQAAGAGSGVTCQMSVA